MNSVYDMVVSFLRHGEVESQTEMATYVLLSQTEMATYVLFTVHADADTDRHRQTPTFKSSFYPDLIFPSLVLAYKINESPKYEILFPM